MSNNEPQNDEMGVIGTIVSYIVVFVLFAVGMWLIGTVFPVLPVGPR